MSNRSTVLFGIAIATLGQLGLMTAEGKAPAAAALMLAIGAALFADGMRGRFPFVSEWVAEGNINSPGVFFGRKRGRLSFFLGIAALLILFILLVLGATSGWYVVLWLTGLALIGAPFVREITFPPRDVWYRSRYDIAFVAFLMALFLALNVRDLTDWYYAAIGDEYSFYGLASHIIENGLERPFSQAGVYDTHPMLNSAYQSLVMLVFGRNNFGWRMASVLSIVVTIPGIYILTRALAYRHVAIISTMLFSLSHYIFAYAHTGYNTIHALAPSVWSLAFFVLGLRKRSASLLFAGGVLAGLGFYTLFSARATVAIIALFVLTDSMWRKRLKELWPLALGFISTAAMILAASKAEIITHMLVRVVGGYSESISGSATDRIITNAWKNLIAFNFNPDQQHYVAGSLLDAVTAVLFVLGLGLAIYNLRHPSYRLLVIWLTVGFIATGLLSPYPGVAISRLNYMVPVLAILAGLAAVGIWERFFIDKDHKVYLQTGMAAGALLFLVVLALNAKQFWIDTPKTFQTTREAKVIGAIRAGACGDDPRKVTIVDQNPEPLLGPALASYYTEDIRPPLIGYEEAASGSEILADAANCVILVKPEEQEAQRVLQDMQQRRPGGQTFHFPDSPETERVLVFVTGSS